MLLHHLLQVQLTHRLTMVTPTFVIPLNREDLLAFDTPGQYFVQQLIPSGEISRKLAGKIPLGSKLQ